MESVNDNNKPYKCRWRLKNEKGETRIESFKCVDLKDFERIYGDNSDTILWVTLRQEGQAML